MTDVEDIVKCDECGSRNLENDTTKGEIFCKDCGLVLIDELMEERSSVRENPGDPTSPMAREKNREGFALGSHVGNRNLDGSLDRSRQGQILRRTSMRMTRTSQEKNQMKGIVMCNMLISEFTSSTNMKSEVAWVYKRLMSEDIMRGASLEVRAAAIVYYVFKDGGINVTIPEIIKHNSAHPRQVAKLARKIASYFRKPWILSQRNMQKDVEKYCNKLQTNRVFTSAAIEVAMLCERIANEKYVCVNNGFVAACIYMAGILQNGAATRTQLEISDVCNITEVTLRTNMLKILVMLDLDKESFKELSLEEFLQGARNTLPKGDENE